MVGVEGETVGRRSQLAKCRGATRRLVAAAGVLAGAALAMPAGAGAAVDTLTVFQTCKHMLSLERHGARTINGLRARVGSRMLALAARVYVNWWLGRPTRSLVAFVA